MLDRLMARTSADKNGCLLWTGCLDQGGYGYVRYGGRNGKTLRTHRAVYVAAFGDIPSGLHVLHKCDVRKCINPSHLFLGTNADNVADRDSKKRGRVPSLKGSDCPWAKLSQTSVSLIRNRLRDGETHVAIAKTYGVNPSLISMIKSGHRWASND